MSARRRASHRTRAGGSSSVRQLLVVAVVLLVFVVVALRLLPGSPFAISAVAEWGVPGTAPAASQSGASPKPSASPAPPPPPPLPVRAANVQLEAQGWWGWAILDLRTGKISGSKNMTETSTTASMIKAWVAADYLRRAAEAGKTPSNARLDQLTKIIRDSNNEHTEAIYTELGRLASIDRLFDICELTDSSPSPQGGWSRTQLSPRDTARMAGCIADGRAAGPEWTEWLLKEMRLVRGTGDFGIRQAFPTEVRKTIAIKNGWVDRTAEQEMHISCLAIGDGWTMGVLTRYPIRLGYEYGMKNCQEIAEQLRTTH
ncbi:MAG TPA: hypothetical protein VFX61_09755 [Micromonosporaceae bacterium]|nr:hypothetical protein [Micromonosporaceae bacterium]